MAGGEGTGDRECKYLVLNTKTLLCIRSVLNNTGLYFSGLFTFLFLLSIVVPIRCLF